MMGMGLALACLSGCFRVVNTDGIQKAFEDVDFASSKVSELKALKNVPANRQQKIVDEYRDAKSKVNGYLQSVSLRAATYTVNEPLPPYVATHASESVQTFAKDVDLARGPGPASVTGIAVAAAAVEEIFKLNEQWQAAAYARFQAVLQKYKLKNYEEISAGSP